GIVAMTPHAAVLEGSQDQDVLRSRMRWVLAGLTALVYWRVSSHGFINYDDPVFVSLNPHVYSGLSFKNLVWAFTTLNGDATSYQPLTWLTHQLDCQLFGLRAGPQHLTSLWLHIANSVLLFTLLDTLTNKPWRSAIVAALFALHPLHIETVAWISERKTLVCVFFWLLTTQAYVRYTRVGGRWNYMLVLALYAAALLSKPIAVSLPITLFLLDYWPLNRLRFERCLYDSTPSGAFSGETAALGSGNSGPQDGFSSGRLAEVTVRPAEAGVPDRLGTGPSGHNTLIDQGMGCCHKPAPESLSAAHQSPAASSGAAGPNRIGGHAPSLPRIRQLLLGIPVLEKAPLFLLSAAACWVTVLAQEDLGATRSLQDFPLTPRLHNSVVACALYLRKMIWPVDLAPIYPLRDWPWWWVALSGFVLASISLWVLTQARKRRYLLVGWLWYLVTILPTIGLVQVGSQSLADRYSYVPLVGVFLLVVWQVSELAPQRAAARLMLRVGAAGVLMACAVSTLIMVQNWETSLRLFQHAVRVTKGNFIAYCQLALAFVDTGNLPEGERLLRESLKIMPDQLVSESCLGDVLFRQGKSREAFEHYSRALRLKPSDADIHARLADLFFHTKDPVFHDPAKALREARLACQLSHYHKQRPLRELALVCAENHRFKEAADAAQKVLALCVGAQETESATRLETEVRRMEMANR
ncbi:MAG TPA: tetratricopeptide repeat protein, partial [Verrucomicrobiae bacterium]|nr:tetratricopeptide repeat protein [Verrucomicrobiae bacterium]